MKNTGVRRFTSAALALAIAMSMGVGISAEETNNSAVTATPVATSVQQDYSVNVTQGKVQFIRGGNVVGNYDVATTDIKLMIGNTGNLVLVFTKADGKASAVSLGKQSNVVLNGDYTSLTIDGSVPVDHSFTIGGNIGSLIVNAPVVTTITDKAVIKSLQVGNGSAKIYLMPGAQVAKASAVSTSSISGFSGTITTTKAVAPNAGTVKPKPNIGSTKSTSNKGKEEVSLNMNEADDTKNTEEVNFMNNNSVELIAQDGVSLGQAMKDVKLEVTHDTDKDNDRVGGQWKWVDTASTTRVSGTYIYRFYPSLSSRFPTIDVKVKYSGTGESNSTQKLGKPSISFAGKSHGKGGNVRIDVKIPSGVEDDATLILEVDRHEQEYSIDESDAGEENSYTAYIDTNDLKDEDKVKIRVKIKSDGKTSTSNSISYQIDGDPDKTAGRLSIDGSDSSGRDGDEFDVTVTMPDGFDSGTLKISVSHGSVDGSSSVSVTKGDSKKFTIKASGDKGDDTVVKATLTINDAGKSNPPAVSHRFRITSD